jgi:hypothetical protein
VSYSVAEVDGDCVGGTFLPNPAARSVLGGKPPSEWARIQHHTDAAFVNTGSVEVSIQGTSARVITLTRFSMQVTRHPRPPGVVFEQPCGGAGAGRSLNVDVEATPPKVVASSRDPDGLAGSMQNGRLLTRPIKFPWTVSVTDPLLLYVRAQARSCLCRWTASLAWVSGSQRGTIRIDNDGEAFTVVGGNHLRVYSPLGGRWS